MVHLARSPAQNMAAEGKEVKTIKSFNNPLKHPSMFWIQKEKLIEFMQKLDNATAVGHCFMRKKRELQYCHLLFETTLTNSIRSNIKFMFGTYGIAQLGHSDSC